MSRRPRHKRRADPNATQCAQCEHWSWGCAWPVQFSPVAIDLEARPQPHRPTKRLRGVDVTKPWEQPDPVLPDDLGPRVERFRDRYQIPASGDPGRHMAADFASGTLCPGYVAHRRTQKEDIQRDTMADLALMGVNVEDMMADLGLVGEGD